jgi:hypothetical protein
LKTSLTNNDKELKLTLQNLEKLILDKAYEWARNIFKAIVEHIDGLIKRYREKTLAIEHKRNAWYSTCLGRIRVERRQYRDRDGKYYYPLDRLFGMNKYKHTTSVVKDYALELAASTTFRKSEEILRKMTAIDLSHQTIHRLLARAADTYLEKKDQETKWFCSTGELPSSENKKIVRLYMEADGVMLSLQRRKARKTEVKLGIAYEDWAEVGKDRYQTVNKTFYADIASSDAFWTGMALKLHRKYDLAGVGDIILGGDGGAWIKDGIGYFKGRFQLCRYHLNREIRYKLGSDGKTIKSLQESINNEDLNTMYHTLNEAALRAKGDKAKEIKRLCGYIRANASGLKDYRHTINESGNLRRTGAIEGNIDKLIVRRMKNQGMSWTPEGIRRMLVIRFLSREGKLSDCLYLGNNKLMKYGLTRKKINRVIDKTMKPNYADWFGASLPALYGPHSSRPWAIILKSLVEEGI